MSDPRHEPFGAFYRTRPQPCPYLPGRLESRIVTELGSAGAARRYDALARAGFRRSHTMAYRPACPDCAACVPVRVRAPAFRPGRSLRRVRRRNADLLERHRAARACGEHYALFRRYLAARHGGGEMAGMDFAEYRAMVEETPIESGLSEYRTPDGFLLAVMLWDRLGDGLSAVYSFFAPEEGRRSLGSFMILCLIERAQQLDLPHVYLGYWIAGSGAMAYKSRFRPLEALGPEGWRELAPTAAPGRP